MKEVNSIKKTVLITGGNKGIGLETTRLFLKNNYSKEKDFIGNGKVVYLHLDGDRYLALASSGGG